MQNANRFRRHEQPSLFQPPKILPPWESFPLDIQQNVIRLLMKMLCEHQERHNPSAKKGGEKNE